MDSARRIEHLFATLGGRATIFPPLGAHHAVANDAGELLVLLPGGLDPEERADMLAAAMLRHAAERADPRELLAVLARAFRRVADAPRPCTADSVARWLPADAA